MQSEQPADFDEQMKNYRMHNAKEGPQEQEVHTHERSLTPKSARQHADQLYAWREKKNLKIANKRLTAGQEDLTFSPKLNRKSIDMVANS